MCVVSYVGDYWQDQTVPRKYPDWSDFYPGTQTAPVVTKDQLDELRKDLEELKKLIKQAKSFDESVGEPDCHHETKVALIKAMAKAVDVDLEGLI